MATKVYTSAEFKRERDNFLSLIKNMEKADTKKWLDEVKETLFRDRAGDERKDEYTRLEAVIEKHQNLIPRVTETQVKSEVKYILWIKDPKKFLSFFPIISSCFEPLLAIKLSDPFLCSFKVSFY